MTTMISRTSETPEEFASRVLAEPLYDHCPKWCTESGYERTQDDDHGGVHESGTYAPAGTQRVYACLQRADIHGKPRDTSRPDAEIQLSNGELEDAGRIELTIPVSTARSLARILNHLADMEEL